MEQTAVELGNSVDQVVELSNQFGPLVFRALVLLLIVLLLSRSLGRLLGRALVRFGVPERRALVPVTALHILVLGIGALVVLNLMGFPAFNLFRFVIAASMVILALFIVLRPYLPRLPLKEGDTVSQGSIFGQVEKITFANTMIRLVDGRAVFVPNHKMLNEPMINLSTYPYRRADVEFFIPYDEDVDEVRRVVSEVLRQDERVQTDPAPVVALTEMEPSYRRMLGRFWISGEGYLGARWSICEAIDRAISREGIRLGVPRIAVVPDGAEAPAISDGT